MRIVLHYSHFRRNIQDLNLKIQKLAPSRHQNRHGPHRPGQRKALVKAGIDTSHIQDRMPA